jgi:hypothetical protein
MKTATPKDTWDHTIGAGGLQYAWWLECKRVKGVSDAGDAADDWEYEITADDGDDGEKTVTVNHAAVMRAARKMASKDCTIPGVGQIAKREARNLIFDADAADLDACAADEVLQVIVLGEVVFG